LIEKALAVADRVYAFTRGAIVLEARTSETDLPHRLEQAYFTIESTQRVVSIASAGA
jgi:branched-chain amino acid transport system ATP-binding protein